MGVYKKGINWYMDYYLPNGKRKRGILHLKWCDIDFRNKIVYLVQTKNREVREIPMDDIIFETLLKVRKNPKSPYVFCKKDGHYMDTEGESQRKNKICKLARV